MTKRRVIAAALLVLFVAAAAYVQRAKAPEARDASATKPLAAKAAHPVLPADAAVVRTPHYRIHSTASPVQTAQVARAVESLYARYAAMFPRAGAHGAPLVLVLYRDRAEFKRNNRSRPWAEAYYLPPRSYAYFDAQARNPYHWMLHEATHQLMREASGFSRVKWVDEGVASYLGASRIINGRLQAGVPDPDAYPIWWLPQHALTGNLQQDMAAGQIIPLLQLISGQGGPDENRYFNLYYIHYWSLSHFLFHYRNGMYAESYRALIAEGASVDGFERLIGPIDRVQDEWYAYLQQQVRNAGTDAPAASD